MPCSVPHLVIGSCHHQSIFSLQPQPPQLLPSLLDASWPKLCMTTASWSATLLGPSETHFGQSPSGKDVAQPGTVLSAGKSGPCAPSLSCLSATNLIAICVYLDIQIWRVKTTTSTRVWFICWKMMYPH